MIKSCILPVFEWIHNLLFGKEPGQRPAEFIVSEYYDRIEKVHLNILENQTPIDRTIILWWGLDGLRLNEDGMLEWINRKKRMPTPQNVFYQPCQSMGTYSGFDMCQSAQSTIDTLQIQATQQIQNVAMANALQSYMVLTPAYYAPMLNCCCNQVVQR